MRIEYLKFKNFNSFGDEPVEIDFTRTNGLILLYGMNGTGKSTISDAITFALYGKVPNKKKIQNLVNRYNGNLETEIHVKLPNRKIVIKRNQDPELFEIFDNGNPIDYAYKKNKQKYLENEILGITYEIFNNIISLSVSDFKSFTKRLSVKDKRNIVDRIFGIEFITKMHLLNKDSIASKRNGIAIINKSVQELSTVLKETKSKLEQKKKQNTIESKQKRIDFNRIITESNNTITRIQEQLSDLTKTKSEFEDRLQQGNIKYAKLESEINTLDKKIKLYNNKKCPTCNSDLTTPLHMEHLDELKRNLIFYRKKESEYHQFHKRLSKDIESTTLKIQECNSNINIENNKLLESQIKLTELGNDDGFDDLKKIIEETSTKITKYKEENASVNNEIQVLKIVNDILSENGIKRVLFNRIIPAFNKEVKSILDKLGINFKILIDNKFNTSISYLGQDVPIDTLSTGQLKKIDIGIILTFIKILKTKFSNLNILFLDEVFSSIDVEGRYGILGILKDLSEKYNLNVIVVNHSEMPSELFDYQIKTSLKDNFSYIEIEEIV